MKKLERRAKNNVPFKTSPDIKMSELISNYASDYINMGETTEERQSYLNGACTAWNIANLPVNQREEALRRCAADYQKMNPTVDDVNDYLHDLRLLIQKKLEMFPEVKKVILGAFVDPINAKRYRISVVSSDNPGQLFGR